MRYNLEFRKLTFYGLNGPQSIRKLKRISGQTIFSDPQDLEFNPNFAEKRDIPVVKNRSYKSVQKGGTLPWGNCNRGPKNDPPILEPAFVLVNRWPYMTYLLACLPLAWSIACQLSTVAL